MKKKKYIQFDDGSVVLKKERKVGLKELVISIVLALVLFVCLLIVEGKMLSDYEISEVITSNLGIPQSTQITESNVNSYFTTKKVPLSIIPKSAVTTKEELIGKVVSSSISEGEIIVSNRFSSEEKYLVKMNNPLEVGVSVSNSSQMVGGIIRKGDLINISVVDDTTKESRVVLENVYVSKAFDTNGMEITDAGVDKEALSLNIYIDSNNQTYFSQMLESGTVYISKVLSENILSISGLE